MSATHPFNGRTIDWTGYLYYNGFRFPPQVKVRVETRPVSDASNRTTKYVEYTFYVDFVVTYEDWIVSTGGPDGTGQSDGNMQVLRRRLTQKGCEFKFNGQGFGGLWVNRGRGCAGLHSLPSDTSTTTPTPVVDATFGPHPKVLLWESLGSNKVCRVSWSCTITVPECCTSGNNPYSPWGLYELSYDQSWTVDEQGMTIRTTTASIEMPGYRLVSGTALLNIVDKYREVFFPQIPAGFLRTQTYSMDRAKRRLEVVVIDREIPSDVPFWPNTANMSIVFSVDGDPWTADWMATCSGAITLAPGVPKQYAFSIFAAIFLDRFTRGNLGFPVLPLVNEQGQTETIQPMSILKRVAFTEDIFSRTVTFDFEWECVTTILSLFDSTGMLMGLQASTMNPNPAVGWTNWHTSVWNNMQNQRGYAQLNHPNLAPVDNDDSLQQPCSDNGVQPLSPNGARYLNTLTVFQTPITYTPVSQQNSYAHYQYSLNVVREPNVAVSDNIQNVGQNEVIPPGGQPISGAMINNQDGNPTNLTVSAASSQASDQTLQIRGPSRYWLVYRGAAVRIGYRIPLPRVLNVSMSGGTARPVLIDSTSPQHVLARTVTGPIYGRTWEMIYQLPAAPTGDTLVNIEHDGVSMASQITL